MQRSTGLKQRMMAAVPVGGGLALAAALAMSADGPSPATVFKPAPLVPIASEAPPRIIVDAPLPDQLALGRVVVRYRAENLRILPVFGPAALEVSPRVGHLHVTVDDGPWRWVDSSGEPLVINKLPPGPHKILMELADPTHKVLDGATVHFEVPKPPSAAGH